MVAKYEKNGSGLCCNLSSTPVEKLEDYLPPTTFDDLGFWDIEPGALLYNKVLKIPVTSRKVILVFTCYWNRFQKTDILGSGAFGQVFRATFKENPELKVAVKTLKAQKEDRKRAQEDFKKETDIMKTLEHQYILRLYG